MSDPIRAFVDGYEFRADEGDHTPDENERAMLEGALHGWEADRIAAAQPDGEVARLREYHSATEALVSTWVGSDTPSGFYPNGRGDCDDDEDYARWDRFVAARAAMHKEVRP